MSADKPRCKIIRMANQIALFFASKPEDEAVLGIADHINKLWEKRMRTEFFILIETDADFHPLIRKASGDVKRPND